MKNWISLLLFVLMTNSFAQKFEKFTYSENLIIQLGSDEMMRVYNLSDSLDSITLKTVSISIKPKHTLTELLAKRMLLSVQQEGGVGIAAPQVGINRRMIWVQRFDKPEKPFELFINPEIIWASDLMQKVPEGDLSFDERGFVMRHYAVQIEYQNLDGQTISEVLEGFTSVIFQHERDHLDGILLTDRIEEQKSMEFKPAGTKSDLYFK